MREALSFQEGMLNDMLMSIQPLFRSKWHEDSHLPGQRFSKWPREPAANSHGAFRYGTQGSLDSPKMGMSQYPSAMVSSYCNFVLYPSSGYPYAPLEHRAFNAPSYLMPQTAGNGVTPFPIPSGNIPPHNQHFMGANAWEGAPANADEYGRAMFHGQYRYPQQSVLPPHQSHSRHQLAGPTAQLQSKPPSEATIVEAENGADVPGEASAKSVAKVSLPASPPSADCPNEENQLVVPRTRERDKKNLEASGQSPTRTRGAKNSHVPNGNGANKRETEKTVAQQASASNTSSEKKKQSTACAGEGKPKNQAWNKSPMPVFPMTTQQLINGIQAVVRSDDHNRAKSSPVVLEINSMKLARDRAAEQAPSGSAADKLATIREENTQQADERQTQDSRDRSSRNSSADGRTKASSTKSNERKSKKKAKRQTEGASNGGTTTGGASNASAAA